MSAFARWIVVLLLAVGSTSAFAADSATAELESLLKGYQDLLRKQDVDGVLALYGAKPVFIPEYAPPAVGREAVRKAYEWVFASLKLDGRFDVHEAEVIGDTAWVRTTSSGKFTVIANGADGSVANSELFIFKREGGAWKIHRYIFTSRVPLPSK